VIRQTSEILLQSGIDDALLVALLLEKKCRLNNDFSNLRAICLHMVRLCRQCEDWGKLNSTLIVINKRRAQSKVAISAVVEEGMSYIDSTPNIDVRMDLIKTLMDICEAKIYVEAESARLHMMLSLIYETSGDLTKACDMIQDVHVETYGSLTKKEKAEYILQQIRLNLLRKDYVRALIQSRKMNRKIIEEADFGEIKLSFYKMMIEYHSYELNTWEICQCYYKIFDTSITKSNPAALKDALESCVIYLILSKYDNHQSDMMHRLKLLKEVSTADTDLPLCASLLTMFTTNEIIGTHFPGRLTVESHGCLKKCRYDFTSSSAKGEEIVGEIEIDVDTIATLSKLLDKRIIQHNFRVLSACYTKIRVSRVCELLQLTPEIVEDCLSEVSSDGDLYLKIDRPAGIVTFQKPMNTEEILSNWASDIGQLLNIMESTCHLIRREQMVNNL